VLTTIWVEWFETMQSFKTERLFEEFPVAWKFENLFERNRIFIDRTVNVYNCKNKQWLQRLTDLRGRFDYDVCR
jgi:hypothetical protein